MKEFSPSVDSIDTQFGDVSRRAISTGGERGDRFEKEADRAADAVSMGRAPVFDFSRIAVNPSATEGMSELESVGDETEIAAPEALAAAEDMQFEQEGELMRKAIHEGGVEVEPPGVRDVLRLQGQPLDDGTRQSMEKRFGLDLGKVRIHTDESAKQSARALDAHAYTVGNDIVFGSGEYEPHTERGQHLLSHELAHTVQQRTVSPQLLQRAEFGTYVSKKGDQNYLDAGARYYTDWGFPNVKRVSTVKDVLDDLDRSRGVIDKFRIVSHGNFAGLELGAVPGLTEPAG